MENTEIPAENIRVKQVIDLKTEGNELQFSREIEISQPRINRLFKKNERGFYPTVTLSIIQAITKRYRDIDLYWLVTGVGFIMENTAENKEINDKYIPIVSDGFYPTNNSVQQALSSKDNEILLLKENIATLKKVINTQEKLITALEIENKSK